MKKQAKKGPIILKLQKVVVHQKKTQVIMIALKKVINQKILTNFQNHIQSLKKMINLIK